MLLCVTPSRSIKPGVARFVSFREPQSTGGLLCAGGDVGSGKCAATVPKGGLTEREGQKGPKTVKHYQIAASQKSRAWRG